MRYVVAGGSGFLGTALRADLLAHGADVVRLVRRPPTGPDEVRWDPAAGWLPDAALDGADVVVNLCGAPIARRWTPRYRQVIRTSRVQPTALLAAAVARRPRPPVLVCQSATGYYGKDPGDSAPADSAAEPGGRPAARDESAPAGTDFLADVVQAWEAAGAPAERAGARVVRLRTGVVLDRHGGALPLMALPFRVGAGGRVGSGKQAMPLVALPDWLAALRFAVEHDTVRGPLNVTVPTPASNADLTRAIARTLHRPALLAVPGVAVRAVLGGFSTELLDGVRVVPAALLAAGFAFAAPDVDAAVRLAWTGSGGSADARAAGAAG